MAEQNVTPPGVSGPLDHYPRHSMPDFKPAYLIHGDDHGRIGERRAALRALAEREAGSAGVECFEGPQSTPDIVAGALAAMTFAIGRRFLIVDGAERWKDADIATHLLPALASIGADTTIAFFAREEGRQKVSDKLAKAIEQAGGSVAAERTLKGKELPAWLQAEAARLGVTLARDAAQALVAHVGERQQRLLRELEKLALELGPEARIGVEEVDEVAARSAEHQVWGLVDKLVAGDAAATTRAYLELAAEGESLARLVPLLARRVREVLTIAQRLEARRGAAADQGLDEGQPVGAGPAHRRSAALRHRPAQPRARGARRPRARRAWRQRAERSDRGDPRDRPYRGMTRMGSRRAICLVALVACALATLATQGGAAAAGPRQPQLLGPKVCPRGALPLPADAVAVAARVALRAERATDRPRITGAGLADHGGPRGSIVRASCGSVVWHRTVAVAIDLRRYHPSASLSERVSFVARTRAGYRVYALGH